MIKRLLLPIIPLFIFISILIFLPSPHVVHARSEIQDEHKNLIVVSSIPRQQETITTCEVVTDGVYYLNSYNGLTDPNYVVAENTGAALGAPDGGEATLSFYDWLIGYNSPSCVFYSLSGTVVGTTTIQDKSTYNAQRQYLLVYPEIGKTETQYPLGLPGWTELFDWAWYAGPMTSNIQIGTLALCAHSDGFPSGWETNYLDAITVTVTGTYCHQDSNIASACSTVSDYHFTGVPTNTWILDGSAQITTSMLILNNGDTAAQNLITGTISNNTYLAVLSVTTVTADTNLFLLLNTVTQTLAITQPGQYTATFVITNSGGGISAYGFQNLSASQIDLGWTCIYTGTRDFENVACLTPSNGNFNTADNWTWYRGASWSSERQKAYLPYANAALVQYTDAITWPAINPGEKLVLTFDANGTCSTNGLIATRVQTDAFSVYVNSYNTYPKTYTYEQDVSDLAGDPGLFMFANPGIGAMTGYTSTDNIYLDNVCIFITDRPISSPHQTDPNEPNYITCNGSSGSILSCADVDAILSGWGVNMAQYRADYAVGVSVWDPIGWVPWLIAAEWVMIATLLCWLFLLFSMLLGFLIYALNSIVNILTWLYNFLLGLFIWLKNEAVWFWQSLKNIADGFYLVITSLFLWIGTSLWNILNWTYNTLLGLSYWWALLFFNLNGLRVMLNLLIGAWNLLLSNLGTLFTWLIDTFLVWPWNNVIIPVFQKLWDWFLSSVGMAAWLVSILLNLLSVVWELLKALFLLIWNNVVAVIFWPYTLYQSIDTSINSTAYDPILLCDGGNFWCLFLAGIELLNQSFSPTVIYPIVIVGIILCTIVILWTDIKGLFLPPK